MKRGSRNLKSLSDFDFYCEVVKICTNLKISNFISISTVKNYLIFFSLKTLSEIEKWCRILINFSSFENELSIISHKLKKLTNTRKLNSLKSLQDPEQNFQFTWTKTPCNFISLNVDLSCAVLFSSFSYFQKNFRYS